MSLEEGTHAELSNLWAELQQLHVRVESSRAVSRMPEGGGAGNGYPLNRAFV